MVYVKRGSRVEWVAIEACRRRRTVERRLRYAGLGAITIVSKSIASGRSVAGRKTIGGVDISGRPTSLFGFGTTDGIHGTLKDISDKHVGDKTIGVPSSCPDQIRRQDTQRRMLSESRPSFWKCEVRRKDGNKWMEDEGNGGRYEKKEQQDVNEYIFEILEKMVDGGREGVKPLKQSSIGKRVWLSWFKKGHAQKGEGSAVYR